MSQPEGQNQQNANKNTTLIESLREQPNFLVQKYNEQAKEENKNKNVSRAGGVYIPPHKLRALQAEMMEADPNSVQHQRMMWELLRKSINGIVNKVNISNIQNVVIELLNENILRGRGLLTRAIIKAQMASPNFTHVYAALVSVINSKLPNLGELIIHRVLIQFKRSFQRNNRLVCIATTKMIAHLVNQKVLGEYVALQLLMILLMNPTEDSVQIACDFMIEVGQVLCEVTPSGANAVFERFKSLLHEAEIDTKAQYSIENLFAIRKTSFKDHAGVIPELDLIEVEDQITHNVDLEEEMRGEESLNIFKPDPFYLKTEAEWDQTKLDILGEENIANLKDMPEYEEEIDEEPQQQKIQDLTDQELINLRKTIYLAIQSTVNFEECAHKILKMNIAKGYEGELVDMILECCMMERIYQNFFGLLAERFCIVDDKYKELFIQAFINHYNNIFKQEANKIRNLAKLYGHLFFRHAIDWSIFEVVVLGTESTTAAGRMFLKILFREIAQNMGIDKMVEQFNREDMKQYYEGLFPMDHPNNLRFAINYYTSIGLGKMTESMREILEMQEQIISDRKNKEEQLKLQMLLKEEEDLLRQADEEEQQLMKELEEHRQENQRLKQEELQKSHQYIRYNAKHKPNKRSKSSSSSSDSSNSHSRSSSKLQKNKKNQKHKRKYSREQRSGQQKYVNRSKERKREKSRQRQRDRSEDRQRQKDRKYEKQKYKTQEKQKEREREKQKEKDKQTQRLKLRDIQRQKERYEQEKLKQKEQEKEKEKLKEIEKLKEMEKLNQIEKQRQEKERQRSKQKLRQRQRQKQKQKEKEKIVEIEKLKKEKLQKSERDEKLKKKQKDSHTEKSKRNEKKLKQQRKNRSKSKKKLREENEKKRQQKKGISRKKRVVSSESESSGLSSSSESSSDSSSESVSKKQVKVIQQKNEKNRVESSSDDSQSESMSSSSSESSSNSSNKPTKRVKDNSSSSSSRYGGHIAHSEQKKRY